MNCMAHRTRPARMRVVILGNFLLEGEESRGESISSRGQMLHPGAKMADQFSYSSWITIQPHQRCEHIRVNPQSWRCGPLRSAARARYFLGTAERPMVSSRTMN